MKIMHRFFTATSRAADSSSRLLVTLSMAAFLLSLDVVNAQTSVQTNAQAAAAPTTTSKGKLTLTDHPLVGKIWDAKQQKWVTESELKRAILGYKFILLGETHDNSQHHARHVQILNWLIANKQKPALVMEQFDVEHQQAINGAIALNKTSDDIADAGKLNRKGWQWLQYQPLVNVALTNNLSIAAANLSRADARNVFMKGFSAIPAYALPVDLTPRLFDATWNSARNDAMVETMVASHCGQLPKERTPGMVNAQRARDAVMAQTLMTHQQLGAVLIAGRGHVRRDIGVPLYLKQMDARASAITIGLVEVIRDNNTADAYVELTPADALTPPFDYVWFSARQERPDPCEGMTLGTLVAPSTPPSTLATPATK